MLSVAGTAGAATSGPFPCVLFPTTFVAAIGGPIPITCPPFTVPGATLNSVTLTYSSDYQFGTNAANSIQMTFTPTGPAGVTWTLPTTVLVVSGGTSSGTSGTGSAVATTGVTSANFAAAFQVNLTSAVITGGAATSAGAGTVIYDYTAAVIPPPPVPTGSICSASAVPIFAGGIPNSYSVRYASNLNAGDSVINLTNTGAASTVAFPIQDGNINANVYVFSPDEQLISCCCCPVTPDGLASLSVQQDLISNTLTPALPTSVVVKVVASLPIGTLTDGLAAWGTSLHALPVTPGSPATTYGTAETPFTQATLSSAELTRLTTLCGFIQNNGSGFGICRSCRLGGLGATKKN